MRLALKSAVGFIDLGVADHRPSLIPSHPGQLTPENFR